MKKAKQRTYQHDNDTIKKKNKKIIFIKKLKS